MDIRAIGKTAGKILVLLSLCGSALEAAAQNTFNRFDQAQGCKRENASRIDSELDCNERVPGETVVIEHEVELTTRVEGLRFTTRQCDARVSISYLQKDTLAIVEGAIENSTCGASSGNYVLSVRTRNESGQETSQQFTETWMRDDDRNLTFNEEYPIGTNVDLVRVRVMKASCTCAEAVQPEPVQPE